MKYKFDSTFLELGFIKETLKEFNLPKIPVAVDGMRLYEDALYIRDLGVYKYHNGDMIKISDYYFNRPILNLTTTMSLTTSQYGTDIHEYLGNYLRFLRDYKNINLMSLYNCFSNRVVNLKDDYDENYNYYAIPVKFGQSYTIGFDSARSVEMYCILWDKVEITAQKIFGVQQFLSAEDLENLKSQTRVKVQDCCINKPFIYTPLKDFDASKFIGHFNDLRLIIKMPKYNKSSITVLEGNYIFNSTIDGKVTTTVYHGDENWTDIDDNKYEYYKTYPTNLSLLTINDEQQHPFADRLIEYLLDNAVSNIDNLDDNIKRVQEYLLYLRHDVPNILYGVWDGNTSNSIYNISKDSIISPYGMAPIVRFVKNKTNIIGGKIYQKNLIDIKKDLLMYMDKDVEELFLATGLDDKYTR